MKKTNFLKMSVMAFLAIVVNACGGSMGGSVSHEFIGKNNPSDLEEQIKKCVDKVGGTLESTEFSKIHTNVNFNPRGEDPTTMVIIDLVSPKDKNKMMDVTWSDNKDMRDRYTTNELILSDMHNNVIDKYEDFKDELFKYSDVAEYIKNIPTYCKEAIEASGYKENAEVSGFSIDGKDDATVGVRYKGSLTMSKHFNIAPDKKHIVKK